MKILIILYFFLYNQYPVNDHTELTVDIFPDIDGWQRSETIRTYNADNLWDIINGAADLYLQYDFQELQIAEYINNENTSIIVEIYRHRNNACTFGIYSQERPEKGNFIPVGSQGYKEESILNFYVKDCYIKIRSHDEQEKTRNAISNIAKYLSGNIDKNPAFPEQAGYFPEQGKLKNSEQYINKNFMGLGFLNSAFVAKYSFDNNNFTLFIITKETPEECGDMLQEYLKFAKYEDTEPTQKQYIISDPYNGKITAKWKNNILWGVSDLEDDQLITEYMQLFETELKNKKAIE